MSESHDVIAEPQVETVEVEHPLPVEILIARHPQVQANVEGAFVGKGESPFTELGSRQFELLASCVAAWGPSAVSVSPRTRALAMGERISRLTRAPLHVDADLAEIDFGAAEGLTFEQATKRGVEIDLLGGPPDRAPFKDGETWHAFIDRVMEAGARIEASGPRVAVITHGGVVRALLTSWLGLPHAAAWRFAVPNAAVSTLTLWDGEGTLRTFGVDPGLCAWERER